MSKKLTDQEISDGFKQLEGKLTRLSIFSELIDPYFERIIKDYHRGQALIWVLNELIAHLCGQFSRCCFDESKKNKVISVCNMYIQIKNNSKYNSFKQDEKKLFDEQELKINTIKNYRKKFKDYANKQYNHNEPMSEKQQETKLKEFDVIWPDIKNLLLDSKNLVKIMIKCWEGREADFEENKYFIFREGFWNAIDPNILNNEVLSRIINPR